MVVTRRTRARSVRSTVAVLSVLALAAVGIATLGENRPAAADPPSPGSASTVPAAPGLAAVAPPKAPRPAAQPRSTGTVAVRPDSFSALSADSATGSGATGPGAKAGAQPNARTAAPTAAATVVATNKVAVRALIVAIDGDDFGVATWKATLDRVGAAYDVLHTRTTPLTSASLVRPDGVGRYNAILLTNNTLLYNDNGNYVSGLDGVEWNLLWAYERDYVVRQASLYTSHGTFPEDYCLRPVSEASVGDTALNATLTTAGQAIFDDLKTTVTIPIVQSYVYRTSIAAGCSATQIVRTGSDTLGVQTNSADGRQRIALTFSSNQYLHQANLLVYDVFRWASKGLFLGEQRHYLNVDVDDWFNSADHYFPDGHVESDPGFQMSAHDAYNTSQRQSALRTQYPLASAFTFSMAYNGGDAVLPAGTQCSPNGGVAQFTATTRCLRNNFRWLNHTLTHPELNTTDYNTTYNEINANRAIATQLGISQPNAVLKTGEYSGLGVYNPNPDDDTSPPTDFGLNASNPALLQAATALGVTHLHGNMSFPSHQPACFNCGKTHPMQPGLTVVPDWPTNIAYHTTAPAEQTAFYNSFYGPNGRFPFWSRNLTYSEIVDYEAEIALSHVSTGSIYTHTFHIANLKDYGSGKTLATDWLDRVLAKYSGYYKVPLLSPDWTALSQYASARLAHFAALGAGVDAVYDRTAGQVRLISPVTANIRMSGARTAGFSTYGTDVSAPFALAANTPVTFAPTLRP